MSGEDPIEEMLKRMKPAELPSHVMARLTAARPRDADTSVRSFDNTGTCGQECAHHASSPDAASRTSWRDVLFCWALPVAAGACVAVATFCWLEWRRVSFGPGSSAAAVAPEKRPLPVESEDYLVGARPVGILVAPNQRPYRVVEVEWVEHQTVRTGAGGPDLHTATTRRDVVPVALELY